MSRNLILPVVVRSTYTFVFIYIIGNLPSGLLYSVRGFAVKFHRLLLGFRFPEQVGVCTGVGAILVRFALLAFCIDRICFCA